MMTRQTDLAIVGAGIMGLAHAYEAARAGLTVEVFDRGEAARGASVRNFGMLALAAQAAGPSLDRARRNLATWEHVSKCAGIDLQRAGCLFLAREPEEQIVLDEFATLAQEAGREVSLLDGAKLNTIAPNLRTESLRCGLWSSEAWKIDQRQAPARLARWLHKEFGVTFHFSTEVTAVEPPRVVTTRGKFKANHVLICSGNEFATLFPDAFRASGVTQCQLQMLRTPPQPNGWKLSPFIVGGLSLTRYSAFASCPSISDLARLQREKYAPYLEHGIHVIACQEADGSITIGDSHAYGVDAGSERSDFIDDLIMDYTAGLLSLPDTSVAERWLGHYAHLPGTERLHLTPIENVTLTTMTNGQGMTHAFAIASDVISDLNA